MNKKYLLEITKYLNGEVKFKRKDYIYPLLLIITFLIFHYFRYYQLDFIYLKYYFAILGFYFLFIKNGEKQK